MTPAADISHKSPRLLLTLLVWLLLGLQGLTPLVHAHTQVPKTHGGFHLPEFQQHQNAPGGWMQAHFAQDDGVAIGVAQGLPHQLPRADASPPALAPAPLFALSQRVPAGAAWAQAPPAASVSSSLFFSPPAQAPPHDLL